MKPKLTSSAPRRLRAGLVAGVVLLHALAAPAESVTKTKHNLAANSTADIRAVTEQDACAFCHTPHHSTREVPLWAHATSGVTYKTYTSTTLKAQIGQPSGASKACLSCHDGTVALGMVRGRATPIPLRNRVTTMPVGKSSLGIDLSGHHPISFVFDATLASRNGELKDPLALKKGVKLDHAKQVQCTSCHNPHDNQFGNFLVQDNTGSALCLNCHELKNWAVSSHATSSKTWNGTGVNPWPNTTYKTVAANACENCHAPHNAGGKARLLNYATDEQNCYSCHSGNVAAKNVALDFTKPSAHPISVSHGTHDEAENVLTVSRHATCSDCHNPHAAVAAVAAKAVGTPSSLALSPAITGVKGVNAAGTVVKEVAYEYELCYRCHADSPGQAQAKVPRQFAQSNLRLKFSQGNSSFHSVQAEGRSTSVPSLILPWRPNSRMLCTDCHNSDQSPSAGGSGANGPHGSAYAPLLERHLSLVDFVGESAVSYALCYKCHDRSSILSDQGFAAADSKGQPRGHRFHIVDQQTACTTCHDPHGVTTAKHLINFNTAYVKPSANGRLQYTSGATGSGACALSCHGKDHPNTIYSNGITPKLRK